jgi:hypothetical protein
MLLTDLGSYLDSNLQPVTPWKIMKQIGVEGAVFKGCQEDLDHYVSTIRSIEHARSFDIKSVGVFNWDDPTVNAKLLIDSYTRSTELEKPDFLSVDIEQYKDWQGNFIDPSFLSDHAQEVCEGMVSRFPEILFMTYSAPYMVRYAPKLAKWIDKYEQWTAGYSDSPQERYRLSLEEIAQGKVRLTHYDNDGQPIRYPDGSYEYEWISIKDNQNWKMATASRMCLMRQYSSRIMLPYDLIGGTQFDHQYDWNYVDMTLAEWLVKTKKTTEVEPVATTVLWDTSVPQSDRAWGFEWEPNQAFAPGVALAKMAGPTGWADLIEMPMMTTNWDGNHMTFKKEETFAARCNMCNSAGIPVIGTVMLDAAIGPLEQAVDTNYLNVPNDQNKALTYFLQNWIVEDNWTYAQLNAKKLHFRQLVQINVKMVETHDFPWGSGNVLEAFWQKLVFEYFINPLHNMMVAEIVPSVVLAFKTTPDWLKLYEKEIGDWLLTHTWMKMSYIQDINPSTATFANLGSIFSFVIPENFNFASKPDADGKVFRYPDGRFKDILAHQFGSLQKTQEIIDKNGVPVPVKVFKYQTTKDAAYKNLGFVPAEPYVPPIEPPVTDDTETLIKKLMERVTLLEEWQTKIRGA